MVEVLRRPLEFAQYLSGDYRRLCERLGVSQPAGRVATASTTPWRRRPLVVQVGAHLPQGPWQGLDDVELATLGYVDWFNHRRLHGEITDNNSYLTPAELEVLYYRQTDDAVDAVTR